MAKPTAPLLSFGASGTVAKTAVYSKWKGRPYVRRHVVPANPQSTAQMTTRNTFGNASLIWRLATTELAAAWNLAATGRVLTGRNLFIGEYVRVLRGEANRQDMVFSPGAKSGLPAFSFTATGGAGVIDGVITAPGLPDGWDIVKGIMVAISDGDPATSGSVRTYEATDAMTPFEPQITGLPADDYVVGAWFEFTKADGSTAIGASLSDTATAT